MFSHPCVSPMGAPSNLLVKAGVAVLVWLCRKLLLLPIALGRLDIRSHGGKQTFCMTILDSWLKHLWRPASKETHQMRITTIDTVQKSSNLHSPRVPMTSKQNSSLSAICRWWNQPCFHSASPLFHWGTLRSPSGVQQFCLRLTTLTHWTPFLPDPKLGNKNLTSRISLIACWVACFLFKAGKAKLHAPL